MAQVDKFTSISVAQDFEQYNYDTAITLSTTYASVLKINRSKLNRSIIHFKHVASAAETVSYKIFGSADPTINIATANPETDDSWVNLLSSGAYSHTAETAMLSGSRSINSLTDAYKFIIIMAKASAGTPTLKIWHRGQN